MVKGKSREYFHSSKRVSVNTLKYDFKKYIEPFVDDVSKFGMHSIKSGAAFNSAYRWPIGYTHGMEAPFFKE